VAAKPLRFACTRCGKCCNRSPEVELSEAAALADVFVFRLMFRLYRLPKALADHRRLGPAGAESFFQRKRLLAAYAAHSRPVRLRHDGRVIDATEYLVLSALTLDTGAGACGALEEGRCAIYERRPFACRTVPLHYTSVEADAPGELARFLATPGYACDIGEAAPVLVEAGGAVADEVRQVRAEALAAAERDRPWKEAILRGMKTGPSPAAALPSLQQIRDNAARGAITASMRAAWQIATEAGLMEPEQCRALIEAQLAAIERELALGRASPDARQALAEMGAEYAAALRRR